MLTVADIWEDAEETFGHCHERKLLKQITDAVELLANKGEIDPLLGYVDLCVDGQCVTLPREVETPLAVNIGGRPALGRDVLFSFHLNGPGDFQTPCDWEWADQGNHYTYRDLNCPAKLVAYLDSNEDTGKKLKVWGYDEQNRPLRTRVNGVWQDGYFVPMVYGYPVPDSSAPFISRITGIKKDVTVANVRLSTLDNGSDTGTLLGIFEPDEVLPIYRRIRIAQNAEWIRLFYRRRSLELRSQHDRILLHSRPALKMAMRALKKFDENDVATATMFEATAVRFLTERENVLTPPVSNPIQVHDQVLKHRGLDDVD